MNVAFLKHICRCTSHNVVYISMIVFTQPMYVKYFVFENLSILMTSCDQLLTHVKV